MNRSCIRMHEIIFALGWMIYRCRRLPHRTCYSPWDVFLRVAGAVSDFFSGVFLLRLTGASVSDSVKSVSGLSLPSSVGCGFRCGRCVLLFALEAGSCWSSETYAEVLPPTVSHLMVAGSPDGNFNVCFSFFPFPQRCLNNQCSGNRLSSAWTATASSHTLLV